MNRIANRGSHMMLNIAGTRVLVPKQQIKVKELPELELLRIEHAGEAYDFRHTDTTPLMPSLSELFDYVFNLTHGYSHDFLFRYLDTVGDGSGVKNAIGNYSAAPVEFKIVPPAGQAYGINRLVVTISGTGLDSGRYGNALDLVNGIEVHLVKDNEVIVDLTDKIPILTNSDWSRVAHNINYVAFGQGNEYTTVLWDFSASGEQIWLTGDENEYLRVLLNDNFTGMSSHYFHVQGEFSID